MKNIITKSKKSLTIVGGIIFTLAAMSANASEGSAVQEEQVAVPANACGEINVYSKPPQTKDIYHGWINSIDGQTVSTKSKRFNLSPGKHRIKLIENIVDPRFTRRRGEMMNAKVFEINVEANKKYSIGAKYVRKNRSKLKTGEYWNPIVWKESDIECTL